MDTKNRVLKNIRNQVGAAKRQEAKTLLDAALGGQSWQEALKRLKLADMEKRYPTAFIASGGYNQRIKPYSDTTTNGLTRCLLDFLNFSGHWAVRVNVQGQPRIKKIPRYSIFTEKVEYSEKVTYTKSMTAKGTPDIDSIIFGKAAKIEVKVGKDKIRNEQVEQGARIEAAGGLYFVATDMPLFLEWYFTTFKTFN